MASQPPPATQIPGNGSSHNLASPTPDGQHANARPPPRAGPSLTLSMPPFAGNAHPSNIVPPSPSMQTQIPAYALPSSPTYGPMGFPSFPRPRALTGGSDGASSGLSITNHNSFRQPNGRGPPPPPPGPPPSFQQSQRLGPIQPNQFIPPPPPPGQPGMISVPPPPPRNVPGLGPMNPGNNTGLNPHWQGGWSRNTPYQQMPPPPPPPAGPPGYNPSTYTEQPFMSATYIPGQDSFGPGVGIPGYNPNSDSEGVASPIVGRGHQFAFPPPRPAEPQSSTPPAPVGQPPPYGAPPKKGHSKSPSSSAPAPAPEETGKGKEWPLERVVTWLAANNFSIDWQRTFQALDLHGGKFLDLGIGLGGKGDVGVMYQRIFPQLARECKASGIGWDQSRERVEAKRLRAAIRAMCEQDEEVAEPTQLEPPANYEVPPSEAGFQAGARAEHRSKTPSTAGTGDESPSQQQMAYMGADRNYRAGIFGQAGASSSDTHLDRSGYSKAALQTVDAQHRRHSPSPSSEVVGSYFKQESPHMPAAESPKSGSPGPQSMREFASSFGRHHKSNSTDSVASNLRTQEGRKASTNGTEPAGKEHRRFMGRFKWKKNKDDATHASPDEPSIDSPTSPHDFRRAPPSASSHTGSFMREPSLDRASPRYTPQEQDIYFNMMSRSKSSSTKRYALATTNGFQYTLVDITDAETPEAIKQAVCQVFGLYDADSIQLYSTELGQTDLEEPLNEQSLTVLRKMRGDPYGSLKFYVKSPLLSASVLPSMGITRKAVGSPAAHNTTFAGRMRGDSANSNLAVEMQSRARSGSHSDSGLAPTIETPTQSDLAAAAEDYRKAVEKKAEAYQQAQRLKVRRGSELEVSAPGIKRDGTIDFDHPRVSPYEDKSMEQKMEQKLEQPRSESLVPQREPPPPPPGSATLTKANSLRRKNTTGTPRHSLTLPTVNDENGQPRPSRKRSTRRDPNLERNSWTKSNSSLSPPVSPSSTLKSSTMTPPSDDSDSDGGLFAKPLHGATAKPKSNPKPIAPSYDGHSSDGKNRPSLTLNTKAEKKTVRVETPIASSSSGAISTLPPQQESQDAPINWPPPVNAPLRNIAASENKDKRRDSFARDDIWANRPPPEAIINNLDDFFPNIDLDQPIFGMGDSTPSSASSKPESADHSPAPVNFAQRKVGRSGGLGRTKSIRDVVKNANVPTVQPTVMPTIAAASASKPSPLAGAGGNIIRRKSTKMFGAKIVQVRPVRGGLEPIPQSSIPQDTLPGTPQKTFKWVKGQLIGKGSFGKVYFGINQDTGDFLAVKQVELSTNNESARQKELIASLELEVDTMKDLDHPNIVQWLGFERDQFAVSIFLEYISGGSIGSCLRQHGKFDERTVRSLTRQSLDGLAYLHNQGILHRDLKADNILLVIDGTCKITDFGISKKTDNIYGNDASSTMQGSVFWMAPEVIRSPQGYSAKIDIWSMGCVVLEMFSGRRPWYPDETAAVIYKLGSGGQAPPIPEDLQATISPSAIGFLYDCFSSDPADRPTADTLFHQHPFAAKDESYNFKDTDIWKKIDMVTNPLAQTKS